jgi:uncharacterized repeat protein (TIGR01451 family)
MARHCPPWIRWLAVALLLAGVLAGAPVRAQTLPIYALSGTTATTTSRVYVVSPSTAQLSSLTSPNLLANSSTAFGVDPISGTIYAIRRVNATNPAMYSYVPATGASATVVTGVTGLPRTIVRGTTCPNGYLYVGAATNVMYEIAKAGTLRKTITLTGLPTGGKGGFSCTTDGDFYILANNTNNGANYSLYRIPLASLAATSTTSAVSAGLVGASTTARAYSGLTEAPSGTTGCAAPPTPCLVATDSTSNGLWGVNASSGATTRIGTTTLNGVTAIVGDIGRGFPTELSVSQSVTPTTTVQTVGRTVTFTFTVGNSQALANSVTISDPVTFANFAGSPTWICTVTGPGDPSGVFPTACGAAAGTGAINTYANFSQDSSISFVVTGVLATTFTGTYTNVVSITPPATMQETPSNPNSAQSALYVVPSVNLSITKTNSVTQVQSGASVTYVITVANTGLSPANGARLTDPPVSGLSCTTISCSSASGGASCPAAGSVTMAYLTGTGIVHDLPVNSSLDFTVTCNVTASGL